MGAATQLYYELPEIDERLSRMGLTRVPFIDAANQGFTAFAECTPNHPPTSPGFYAWAETNRALRENLFTFKWGRKNETNQPLVLNERKDTAITSCSGDKYTGRRDGFPSTRSARGERTRDFVRLNQIAFEFMDDPAPVVASTKVPGRATWLFLVYRDMERGELRYELSLPRSMDEDGHVDDWAERIIFPSTPFDTTDPRIGEDDGGQSPEITVEIRKLS
jgi:hypothetical protein